MSFRSVFEHHDELLRAALDEFCQQGFDAGSINRILAASGVSKGQLYHHFATKVDLYLALVEWSIDEKSAWFADHPIAPTDDFLTTFRQLLDAALGFIAERPDVDRFGRSLLAERGRPIYVAVVERFGFDPDTALGALVAHHHAIGALRTDLPLDVIQRFVLLLVNHLPDVVDLDQPSDLSPQVDAVLALLRDGVTAPGR